MTSNCVTAKASENQGIHLISPGQVLVSGGTTYAVGWNTWLSHSAAQAFLNNGTIPDVLVKIDTVNTLKPDSCKYVNYHWVWTPAVQLGTVYYDSVNNASYYFIGTNGATDQLPASGGNWIRLK